MSKPRINLRLKIDTLAHANTIKTNLQTQLIGKDIFEQHSFDSVNFIGENLLYLDVRFNKETISII